MTTLSLIPKADREEFGLLPNDLKVEFGEWARAMHEITRNGRASLAGWAARLNVSPSTLYQKFREWKNTGDWRVLVNKAKAGPAFWNAVEKPAALNPEFVEWFYGFAGQNQRGWRERIRAFHRRWKSWRDGDFTKRFPGFDKCPTDCGRGYPAGMSERNLYRLLEKRPKAQTAMQRYGVAAAMKYLPGVPFSRADVRPLEYIFFDDVRHDRKVIDTRARMPVYLWQLGCLDFCSGVYLKFGQRPELTTADGTRDRLKYRDMKWLVARLLEDFGYPLDYRMHLILERGTATLYKADAQALYDLSDGQIVCCYTGMEGQLVLAWQEDKSGNPRGKSPLESWHNLFHNECGALPGQAGRDYSHMPKALGGMEREAAALATAQHFLTPDQKARVRFPFSDVQEAYFQTVEIVNRINNRTDHDLDGFDKLALWRVNAPGIETGWKTEGEFPSLPVELHKFVEFSTRLESPMERLLRLSAGLNFAKIPNSEMPRFYDDCHVLRKIEDNLTFAFSHEGKRYVYVPDSPQAALPQGNEYLGYFRPHDMGVIHLTEKTKHGPRYVATWKLQGRPNPLDYTAKAKAMAYKQQFVAETMNALRRQNREFIAEQEQRVAENLSVLAEADLVPSELQAPLPTKIKTISSPTGAALQAAAEMQTQAVKKEKQNRIDDAETDDALLSALKK